MIAVQKLGVIFVPVNTELKGVFLEHQVRNIEPRVIISGDELRGAFDTISTDGLDIETTVSVEGGVPLEGTKGALFQDLLACKHDQAISSYRPHAISR